MSREGKISMSCCALPWVLKSEHWHFRKRGRMLCIWNTETDWSWTSTVRPEILLQGKDDKPEFGMELISNENQLNFGKQQCETVRNYQKSAATSVIFSQAVLFSLITPKLHPWSSLLSLRAASSAVAFVPKARNLKLIHVHVSPTNVCLFLHILTLWLQSGLLHYLETSFAAFSPGLLFPLPYFTILKLTLISLCLLYSQYSKQVIHAEEEPNWRKLLNTGAA